MPSPPRSEDEPVLPTPNLRAHASQILRHLEGTAARFVLKDKNTDYEIELSEELYELLREILTDLSQNRAVQILPRDMELSTVHAAEFLRVSRPFVIKLIEQGKLACRLVGTHRRIKLTELIRYRESVAQESQAAREEITKSAEKHGWGY